jgi:hypothetical protein
MDAPGPDALEIHAEIPLPVPAQAIDLLLAGAQGHADQPPVGASLNGVDTQGVGFARAERPGDGHRLVLEIAVDA